MYKYDKIETILVLNRFSTLNIRILLSSSTIVHLIIGIETSGLGTRLFTVEIAMKCMASDNVLLKNHLLKNQNAKNSYNSIGMSRHDTNNTLSSKMLLINLSCFQISKNSGLASQLYL